MRLAVGNRGSEQEGTRARYAGQCDQACLLNGLAALSSRALHSKRNGAFFAKRLSALYPAEYRAFPEA